MGRSPHDPVVIRRSAAILALAAAVLGACTAGVAPARSAGAATTAAGPATVAGTVAPPGGTPGARPDASAGTGTAGSAVACPTGPGTPIGSLRQMALPCLSGTGAVAVAAVHGRPEVINVWASWCAPCRQEAALLERAHRQAGDQVLFLGVDTRDDTAAARRALAEFGVTYPQAADPSAAFAMAAGAVGMPYTLVVDASGRIVYRQIGALTPESLRAGLARAGVTLD